MQCNFFMLCTVYETERLFIFTRFLCSPIYIFSCNGFYKKNPKKCVVKRDSLRKLLKCKQDVPDRVSVRVGGGSRSTSKASKKVFGTSKR